MITYEQIQKANEGLTTIDLKNKPYVLVAQRVKAFRKLYPEGFIQTEILDFKDGVVLMKTEVGFYEGDRRVILGTGMAYEKETSNFINRQSLIENAETSSVGRALGFLALGIDGGGICSAEELANAINNQNPQPKRNIPQTEKAEYKETLDLSELRKRLDEAIKAKTKDMSRDGKIQFVNKVITPTLNGERNWKLCENPDLLQKLLVAVA